MDALELKVIDTASRLRDEVGRDVWLLATSDQFCNCLRWRKCEFRHIIRCAGIEVGGPACGGMSWRKPTLPRYFVSFQLALNSGTVSGSI